MAARYSNASVRPQIPRKVNVVSAQQPVVQYGKKGRILAMPPSTKSRKLGRLVQDQREAKGWSLRRLAELTKTDAPYLHRLERGEYRHPNPTILAALSRQLSIPLANLFALADYPMARGLPDFEPYLRAKTDLPEQAIAQLQEYFDLLRQKYGVGEGNRRSET